MTQIYTDLHAWETVHLSHISFPDTVICIIFVVKNFRLWSGERSHVVICIEGVVKDENYLRISLFNLKIVNLGKKRKLAS